MGKLFKTPNTAEHPRLIGHRGFTVLAPENSLPSFEEAGRHRFWAIETDVHRSRDGVLVCCHNASTLAMYGEDLQIEDTLFDDLMKLRLVKGNRLETYPSELLRMPTFADYLGLCKRHGCVPFIETKGEVVEPVLQVLKREGLLDASVLSSIDFSHIEAARRLDSNIFVHHIFSDEKTMLLLSEFGNAGLSYNYPNPDDAPAELLRRTHECGVKVCLRAGDTREAVAKMLQMGLDYIPTNKIHTLID